MGRNFKRRRGEGGNLTQRRQGAEKRQWQSDRGTEDNEGNEAERFLASRKEFHAETRGRGEASRQQTGGNREAENHESDESDELGWAKARMNADDVGPPDALPHLQHGPNSELTLER